MAINNCTCEICNKSFHAKPTRLRRFNVRFCSVKCKAKSMKGQTAWNKGKKLGFIPKKAFKKGHTPWNKGKENPKMIGNKYAKGRTPWSKLNSEKMPRGENHPNWKGENAKYTAKHMWVYSKLGKSDTCEFCRKSELKGKQIHWTNKDHKYRRNLNDWIRLCARCHTKYDRENNLRQI